MTLGLDPELFWNSTPREADIIAAGVNERLRLEYNARMRAIYVASPVPFARDRPALKTLLIPPGLTPTPRRRMTTAEIKQAMQIAFPRRKTSAKKDGQP